MSRLLALGSTLLGLAAIAVLGLVAWAWYDSRLAGSYNAMELAVPDSGGGPHAQHMAAAQSLEQLHGPQAGEPDFATTLTAQKSTVRLSSGPVG